MVCELSAKLRSTDEKMDILKTFKKDKPNNLYVCEYLTKNRNEILFKLRKMKSCNVEVIKSVYIFGGNVCVKLVNSNKFHIVNNMKALKNFTEDLAFQHHLAMMNHNYPAVNIQK